MITVAIMYFMIVFLANYSSSALRDVTRLRSIMNICSNQMSHVLSCSKLDKMRMIDIIIIYFNNDFSRTFNQNTFYLYQSFLYVDINLFILINIKIKI